MTTPPNHCQHCLTSQPVTERIRIGRDEFRVCPACASELRRPLSRIRPVHWICAGVILAVIAAVTTCGGPR